MIRTHSYSYVPLVGCLWITYVAVVHPDSTLHCDILITPAHLKIPSHVCASRNSKSLRLASGVFSDPSFDPQICLVRPVYPQSPRPAKALGLATGCLE